MTGMLVTGMHHSGTSVITGLLAASGWHPGENLLPDDPRNGKRYFEDASLVELHRSWFAESAPDADNPRDWGLTHGKNQLTAAAPHRHLEALAFIEGRNYERQQWVAKDPRTSLVLPSWANVPDVAFLLVYRSPWDVVHSLVRVGAPFSDDPNWVRAAWQAHNMALLEHANQYRERCLIVAAESVLRAPHDFLHSVERWTGAKATGVDVTQVINPDLFTTRPQGSSISRIYDLVYPELTEVLARLDEIADFPRESGRKSPILTVPGGTLPDDSHVHVVIPCRNDGAYLAEAVASVDEAAAREGQLVELTVVDDGSDDAPTTQLLARLENGGYHVIHQQALGQSAARNAGIACSASRAVIPLDSDNRIRAALLRGAHHVLFEDADVVYGAWKRFGSDDAVVEPPTSITWSSFAPHNTVDACAVIRRSALESVGGYDESLPTFEDWEMWMRLLAAGAKFHRLDEPIFDYLVRSNSLTARANSDPELIREVISAFFARFGAQAADAGADVSWWQECATNPVGASSPNGSSRESEIPTVGRTRLAGLLNRYLGRRS